MARLSTLFEKKLKFFVRFTNQESNRRLLKGTTICSDRFQYSEFANELEITEKSLKELLAIAISDWNRTKTEPNFKIFPQFREISILCVICETIGSREDTEDEFQLFLSQDEAWKPWKA